MCQKHSTDFFTDRVTLLMLVAALSIKLTIFRRAWKRYYECKICSTNIFLLKKEISQFAKVFLKWSLTRGMLKAYTQLHPSNNKIRTLWNDRKNG